LFLSIFPISILFCQSQLISWSGADVNAYLKSGNQGIDFNVINDEVLQINTNARGKYFFSIIIPEVSRNVSKYINVYIPVANTSNTDCRVSAMLNDKKWIGGSVVLKPGESDRLEILFLHKVDKTDPFFPNMDGVPGGGLYIWDPVDPSNLTSIQIEIQSDAPVVVTFDDILVSGNYQTGEQMALKEDFFPFIDEYGQYKHDEWPGKIHSDEDLVKNLEKELREFSLLKEPDNFDQYGGWKSGPKLKAKGNFYVEKVDSVWWLVDPEGNLFWSHGVNCVGFGSGNTLITGREKYFETIPDSVKRYNFYTDNLAKKFNANWQKVAPVYIHKRLKSWGMNTIANWSDPGVYLLTSPRTPYTANISYRSPAIDGASYKFPDVFDPQFKKSLEAGVKRVTERTLNDSWCIGYFIDNELYLSEFNELSNIAMRQNPEGATKKALIDYLKKQYKTIRNLNRKYKTKYRSWDALYKETSLPKSAVSDIEAFNHVIIDKYYSTCRNALKNVAPEKLYLGNRFNLYRIYYPDDTLINSVIKAAAKYCDVVSINYYRFTCEDLILPDRIDKPIIIGEFHFGALDRGLPHTGLRNVANQEQRSRFYQYYVNQALQNPQIVGTHWFQYGDQPYTGRSDGENYQIGFVDICDTPYPETIKAIRSIGYKMYNIRSKK